MKDGSVCATVCVRNCVCVCMCVCVCVCVHMRVFVFSCVFVLKASKANDRYIYILYISVLTGMYAF